MKHIVLGFATILCAAQVLATPLDLGRAVAAAADEKSDVAAPIAKTFETILPDLASAKDVDDNLFSYISAVGGVLPSLSADQRKAAVAGSMKAAEACAKAIGALPEGKDLDANDTLGKCYATAIAALSNVLPPEGIRKEVLDYALSLVPAAFAEQAKAAAENPADVLGRVKVYEGKGVASEVRDALKDTSASDDESGELLNTQTQTTSTTTTTTTTTTSTTQVVIKLHDVLVDPITLEPIQPTQPGKPISPYQPPVVVPTTAPSPTPVGRR